MTLLICIILFRVCSKYWCVIIPCEHLYYITAVWIELKGRYYFLTIAEILFPDLEWNLLRNYDKFSWLIIFFFLRLFFFFVVLFITFSNSTHNTYSCIGTSGKKLPKPPWEGFSKKKHCREYLIGYSLVKKGPPIYTPAAVSLENINWKNNKAKN